MALTQVGAENRDCCNDKKTMIHRFSFISELILTTAIMLCRSDVISRQLKIFIHKESIHKRKTSYLLKKREKMAPDIPIDHQKIQSVDCMIMAAGLSSRMGQWKMMLPFFPMVLPHQPTETILDISIKNALKFCRRVILVTGYRGSELAYRYRTNPRVIIVHNSDYQKGLFSSIKKGLSAIKTEHLFITHGDMPFISYDVFSALWQHKQTCTLFPIYDPIGQQSSSHTRSSGHPVLIHCQIFSTIMSADDSIGMKKTLCAHPYKILNVHSNSIYKDIDTPKDYHSLIL
ncbi:Molybdenum cofactor cytidylyltransferase [invertebrate metagenome]|uniref:Molybdenum cofactor cytidylyltransferase n=1 Tax=invertebrate metagenome TaxID=1711999 RepID=A0A2H9T400_9ZZZZ